MIWPTPVERYVKSSVERSVHVFKYADFCKKLAKAAETLNEHGAKKVYAIVTHGILSGKAIEIVNSSCLEGLVVTNSTFFFLLL